MEKQGYRENYELLVTMFPARAGISIEEAAKAMGVNHKTVRAATLRARNPLPCTKMGSRIVIPIAGLARWMCG